MPTLKRRYLISTSTKSALLRAHNGVSYSAASRLTLEESTPRSSICSTVPPIGPISRRQIVGGMLIRPAISKTDMTAQIRERTRFGIQLNLTTTPSIATYVIMPALQAYILTYAIQWDTYRTLFPFMALHDPATFARIVRGMINIQQHEGSSDSHGSRQSLTPLYRLAAGMPRSNCKAIHSRR